MRGAAFWAAFLLGLCCTSEALAQDSGYENSWYVTASSGLRVRDMAGNAVARIDWGEPVCEKADLVPTGRRDTVENLPGEWMRFSLNGEEVQVFNAYLWCAEPPSAEVDWAEHCSGILDGRNLTDIERCSRETEGGSSQTDVVSFVGVTPGQAHQYLRMLLKQHYAERVESMWPETLVQWKAVLSEPWNPTAPLDFTCPHEGGATSWTLEYDAKRGIARIRFSMGSC